MGAIATYRLSRRGCTLVGNRSPWDRHGSFLPGARYSMGAEGLVHRLTLALLAALTVAGGFSHAHAQEQPLPPKSSSAAAAPSDAADNPVRSKGIEESPANNKSKRPAKAPPQKEPDQTQQFRLGIQTKKSVQVTDPTRSIDCDSEDECRDYSGLPRSAPAGSDLKSIRKPFLGLSITTPLPW